MAKKYELEIPDNMFNLAHPELAKRQGEFGDQWDNALHEIGWLTEIKGPLNFEEWDKLQGYPEVGEVTESKNLIHLSYSVFCSALKHDRESTWNACLENQKLGVVDEEKDRKKFESALFKFSNKDEETAVYTKSEWVWFCALKYARGLS